MKDARRCRPRSICWRVGYLGRSGQVPDSLTQVSQEEQAPFKTLASRPMCRYPLSPRYDGHGDPSEAASFTCAKQ